MTDGILGHYALEEVVGEGGWGVVYRARDLRLKRRVAVKAVALTGDEESLGWIRLLREAQLASCLNHPHICTIYDAGEDEGRAYIAMEFVEGRPLSELIPPAGMPTEQVVSYARQIGDALSNAHSHGVVHGDIKPSNILVTGEGNVKIVDFGLGRRFRESAYKEAASSPKSLLEVGPVGGTLPYASPEVLSGKPKTTETDIWAFGVVMYQMAVGKVPFNGATAFELGTAIMTGQYTQLPATVPEGLRSVIGRCLTLPATGRYRSGQELLTALANLRASGSPAILRAKLSSSRRVLLAAGLATIVLLLSGLYVSRYVKRTPLDPGSPSTQSYKTTTIQDGNPDLVVWVNTESRVYHCPGTRWYAKTSHGFFLTQWQAQAEGYRPAKGDPCK
jgi:serine/threonine protein kinase